MAIYKKKNETSAKATNVVGLTATISNRVDNRVGRVATKVCAKLS